MKIFIDESGIFSPSDKANAWATVGALTVPESSMPGLTNALRDLKNALGVDNKNEIKNPRPDSNQSCFINFLKKLKYLNCTLHVATTNCGLLKENELVEHRKGNIQGLNNFKEQQRSVLSPELFDKTSHHVDSIVSILGKISHQEYVQCVMQSYLLSIMLDKVIYFYSLKNPKTLSSFSWVIDQKNEEKSKFQLAYQNIMPGLIEVHSVKRNKVLPKTDKANYSYLKKSFCPEDTRIDDWNVEYYKKAHNKDLTSIRDNLAAIDYFKIFNQDMQFSKSTGNIGLEAADLVVSSMNRCLKGNFSNNEKMARALGPLLLNSPRINESAISMMVLTNNLEPVEFDDQLFNMMNDSSSELYSQACRVNLSNKLSEFE